jgi:hypothetical protein
MFKTECGHILTNSWHIYNCVKYYLQCFIVTKMLWQEYQNDNNIHVSDLNVSLINTRPTCMLI